MIEREVEREDEMRIAKMISEGGPVLEQYFTFTFNEAKDKDNKEETEKEKLKRESMIGEGGIGAEVYYEEDEKIAKKDAEKKKH